MRNLYICYSDEDLERIKAHKQYHKVLRAQLVKSGIYFEYNKIYAAFKNHFYNLEHNKDYCPRVNFESKLDYDLRSYDIYRDELYSPDYEYFDLNYNVGLINRAFAQRMNRLMTRIEDIFSYARLYNYNCYFLTLTFPDRTLKNNSVESLRKYITRFLFRISSIYVANIDYSPVKHRLHFHAVVVRDKENDKKMQWVYKACCYNPLNNNYLVANNSLRFEFINYKNSNALSSYISKLSLHALKVTLKRTHIIYSKHKDVLI